MPLHKIKHIFAFLFAFTSTLFAQDKFENYQFRSVNETTSKRAISTIIKYDYYKMMDETKDYSAVQMKIKTNIDLNAKVSYRLNNHLTSSFRIKNIFGSHYEYGFADPIGRMFLVGVEWKL